MYGTLSPPSPSHPRLPPITVSDTLNFTCARASCRRANRVHPTGGAGFPLETTQISVFSRDATKLLIQTHTHAGTGHCRFSREGCDII